MCLSMTKMHAFPAESTGMCARATLVCLQVDKLRTVRKRKGLEGDKHALLPKFEGAATPAGSTGKEREEVEVIDPSPTGKDARICAQLGISTSQLQALVAHCIERLESKRMDPGGHRCVHALRQAAAPASYRHWPVCSMLCLHKHDSQACHPASALLFSCQLCLSV